jgi:hypothetical protein
VLLHKAIYKCLRSALIFYKKLAKDLKSKGFKLNRYDPCVDNKIMQGKKCTVLWHVEDLKMLHMSYDEVTSMINWLQGIYGEMKVSRGEKSTTTWG